jgi:two-component system chemotaxis response regulator CheY
MADRKLLSARRFEAYRAMSDVHKVSSIAVRRERHLNPRVLIIEDDRFTAVYATNILSKEYDLTVCRTGEEGLAAYIEQAPDIVFLDVHMPGLSGHETLAGIKAVDPKAFVVMLSADTMKTNIVQAADGGAKNFLKKPFSKERLLNTVKNSPYVRGFEIQKTDDGEGDAPVH